MAVQVERLVATLEARLTAYEKAMAKAARTGDQTFQRIESRGKRMERSLSGLVPNFGGFVRGILPAVTAVGTLHTAMQTLGEASALVEFGDRVGLTTDLVQQLEFGFSQAGVEADQFRGGIEKFAEKLGDAATKGGYLSEVLKANGVALRDNAGQMRPTADLLKDFARLVTNAGSEQEKLTLATEAFGDRAGRKFVEALADIANGFDGVISKTNEFGGVVDAELLRRAKELDDRFAAMWRNFSVNAKSAVLTAVDWLDRLRPKTDELRSRLREAFGFDAMPITRIDRAFDTAGGLSDADRAIADQLRDRFGKKQAATVLPDPEALRLRDQTIKKTRETIEALTREYEALGKTNEQKRIANELAKAGIDATTKEGQSIAELVRMIEAKENALEVTNKQMDDFARRQKESVEAAQYLGDTFEQTALSIVGGTQKASEALKEMAVQLAIAAAKALLLGQGPLAGMFGPRTLPGGDVSPTIARQIAGGFGGLFADGGKLGAGKWGIAGEKGPEIIAGPATVIPMRSANDRSSSAAPIFHIDARGAQAGVGEEIKRALNEYAAGSFARHVANSQKARSRRMLQ